jgi:hypothetical protein
MLIFLVLIVGTLVFKHMLWGKMGIYFVLPKCHVVISMCHN